jgi:hypothetical protein
MRRLFILTLLTYTLSSCGGGNEAPPAPTAATLSSPVNNEACTTGTVISDTESRITFSWVPGDNADSYQLTVTNLLNQAQQTQTASTTNAELTLKRNTPYSWYVTSKSSKNPTTANSTTWKFYNAGPASSTYPPYPAEIVSPTLGQLVSPVNGKITLQWRGSDADNDIINYDIYLGTSSTNLTLIKSQHISTTLGDVAVNANTTYYWKVITRDAKGNTSDSGLFEFRTN